MRPDADLVLAIKKTKKERPGVFRCRHVKGHQDGRASSRMRKRDNASELSAAVDSQSEIDSDGSVEASREVAAMFRLRQRTEKQAKDSSRKGAESTEARINIACDELASAVTETVKGPHDKPANPTMEMPYQGSEIMLNINGTWITSDVKRELYRAQGMGPMKE